MTGALLAFIVFLALLLVLLGWVLVRATRKLDEEYKRDIEELRKRPP